MENYDIIILGAGTGGFRLANHLSHKNKKVLVVEPSNVGGTCLNVGCIPTKALIHAAHSYKSVLEMKELGINVKGCSINFKKMISRVRGIVESGRDHIEKGIKKNENLTLIKGKAFFVSQTEIKVGTKMYSAEKIVVATGSKNIVVPIEGLEKTGFISNETILDLKKLPKSLVCIGGGYIACEFACFFAALGVKVTILEKSPSILKVLDTEATSILNEEFKSLGIDIQTNVDIIEVNKKNGKKKILVKPNNTIDSKVKTIKCDEILIAIGRSPNTQDLKLENARVKLGHRNEIIINNLMETSTKNIYAIGDVTGQAMFAHAVKREANILLNNLLNKGKNKMNFSLVPWAVFTMPVVSGVGLSEYQLKSLEQEYGVLKSNFSTCGRTKIMNSETGFVKIFFDRHSNEILGATIIGERADDLIHEIVTIMNSKSPTVDILKKSIHIHPTVSEVMENLVEED